MTEKVFAEIIKETKGVVLSAIEKTLFNRFYHAIDDVAQETYLRAYKSLERNQFREDSTIQSWLYTIARNESLRMNSKLLREEEKFRKSLEDSYSPNLNENNEFDEEIYDLYEKIEVLPEKYRAVMMMIAEGYKEKEITKHLNIKKGTVKSRASRGREMLYKLYKGGKLDEKNTRG